MLFFFLGTYHSTRRVGFLRTATAPWRGAAGAMLFWLLFSEATGSNDRDVGA